MPYVGNSQLPVRQKLQLPLPPLFVSPQRRCLPLLLPLLLLPLPHCYLSQNKAKKEVTFVGQSIFASCITQKALTDIYEILWTGWACRRRKWLDIDGDLDYFMDYGSIFRIVHHYEIHVAAVSSHFYSSGGEATPFPAEFWDFWSLLILISIIVNSGVYMACVVCTQVLLTSSTLE